MALKLGRNNSDHHWLSVSDMMAGLMVIFLFIAISYIRPIVQIATAFDQTENDLYEKLYAEFKEDLDAWNAEIERQTLLVRFREPSVLFDPGQAALKPAFTTILADFFPRYTAILAQYRENIEEIRIEGHTSTEWETGLSVEDAYFRNMELSQGRTRAVLQYCLKLTNAQEHGQWLRSVLTANGLSSSRLIANGDGTEDKIRSRRVEFRVRTNARSRIEEMLKAIR